MERTVPTTGSEEIQLYMRTYYSLLRTTDEVQIQTLVETHLGMDSLLHVEAREDEIDVPALVYCSLRLPPCIWQTRLVVMGQSERVFAWRGYPNVEQWQSVAAPGRRRRAFFDGQPLDVVDLRQIPLPPHDPKMMHHLRVELQFPDELESVTEVTFGGAFGDTVDTTLTALPVTLIKGRHLPSTEAMQGWFLSHGRPLQVHSKEKGLVEILFIRDPEIQPVLEKMLGLVSRGTGAPIIHSEHRLRFLHARHYEQQSSATGFELFRLSPPFQPGSAEVRGIFTARAPGVPFDTAMLESLFVAYRGHVGCLRRD